jgi:hypothetical protein
VIESVQRGNVTIITALTSLLIVMITVFGTAISNQASNSTRIQTSSDTAALAAAESYIGVINDEVAFDVIDWGLGFVQRLAQLLEDIGDAIEAIPYVGAVIGGIIVAIAQAIQSVASSAQDAFDNIKKALDKFLEEAKQILATINATLIAAQNGYLGFILPTGFLNQAALSQYTLKDVQAFTDKAKQIDTDAELNNLLYVDALHTIWDSGRCSLTNSSSPSCKGNNNTGLSGNNQVGCGGQGQPACRPDGTRLGATKPTNQEQIQRDTFHLQAAAIPGCTPPTNAWTDPDHPPGPETNSQAWSHSCDEKTWFEDLVKKYYFNDIQTLEALETQINFDGANNNPVRFSGSAQDKTDAKKLLDDLIAKLKNESTGTGSGTVDSKAQQDEANVDKYGPGQPGPFQHCVLGSGGGFYVDDPNFTKVNGFYSFKCNNQYNYGPVAKCQSPPAQDQIFPCLNYWGLPDNIVSSPPGSISDPKFHFTKASGFPNPPPALDYRDTSYYNDEILPPDSPKDAQGNRLNKVSQWLSSLRSFKPSVSTADQATKDVTQDFIQVSQIQPFYPETLAYHVAGKGDPPTRYAINATKAIVHRADSRDDKVRAADLCDNISDKVKDGVTQGKSYDSLTRVGAPLSFLPNTVYGWCVLILGFFDVLTNIYNAISDFFHKYIIDPIRSFSFTIFGVTICPFCWFADLVQDLLDYLLGPPPPDSRTWHIALVSVACIPAVGTIAQIAGVVANGTGSIEKIISNLENQNGAGGGGSPGFDSMDSTCNGASNSNADSTSGQP